MPLISEKTKVSIKVSINIIKAHQTLVCLLFEPDKW